MYNRKPLLRDYGNAPLVVNIDRLAGMNNAYRTALWSGEHLQLTLMCLPVGGEIGLESHPNLDQFLRIEEGTGLVKMGHSRDNLTLQQSAVSHTAILIPAGTWHNLINTGATPLKLYSIYAPPQHPFGTIHATKATADSAEHS